MKQLSIKPMLYLLLVVSFFSISAHWVSPIVNKISDCGQDSYEGESPVYEDNSLARIDLMMSVSDLELIFEDLTSNREYPAMFVFNKGDKMDTIRKVGFKLKGMNSANRNITKKSFEVVFDSFEKGVDFHGLQRLVLEGQHKDPTMMRAKIAADLFQEMKVVTPRTNHVQVYINGIYHGVYLNVEPVDEKFLAERFGNKNGNLYKASTNASLGYLGVEANRYKTVQDGKRVYQLKTNAGQDDYSDLANFINRLHLSKEEDFQTNIDRVFNVDMFLRTMAVDIFIGNWEGYSFNIGNYYLYHNPRTDKFEYIPYNLENTFGIDELSEDWAMRNIYSWTPKDKFIPLHERLLKVQDFRKRFSYYMSKLVKKYGNPASLGAAIDCRKKMIQEAAALDQYRTEDYGYTLQKFNASFDKALEGHVKYGLKEYIEKRYTSIVEQLDLVNINPIVFDAYYEPNRPRNSEPLVLFSTVEDESKTKPTVALHYKCDNASWQILEMKDNGSGGDKHKDDDIFAATLMPEPSSRSVEYYIEAVDATGLITRYPKEGTIPVQMRVGPKLFINEWMPINDSIIMDAQGEYDSWIEIYNGEEEPIWLGDYFLTNDFRNTRKWGLPSKTLMPKEFMILWVDGEAEQGKDHVPFTFDFSKKQIGIFGPASLDYALIDTVSFKEVLPDVVYGLPRDGQGIGQVLNTSTPGYPNILSNVSDYAGLINSAKIDTIYPNPFTDIATFAFSIEKPLFVRATIYNIKGKKIVDLTKRQYSTGTHKIAWSISPAQREEGVRTFIFKLYVKDGQGNEFSPPLERFYWSGN
ncbi:MAG: CotH kinase family protein [Chitinophagales bacterium]